MRHFCWLCTNFFPEWISQCNPHGHGNKKKKECLNALNHA